jgi:GNAT superfamily N-acetyltransferase
MDVYLRLANPETDYVRIAELMNTVDPEPVTAETLHERERNLPPGRIEQRLVAVDRLDEVVGVVSSGRNPWMKPGHFWQWLIVDSAARRQGIGTLLYNMARQFLREQEATEIEIEVRESSPTGLHFAQQRGFTVDKLSFESSLDLSHFDEAPFSSVIEEVEASGIRFFTMEDVGNTLEAQQRLYEINRRFAADNPGNDGTFASFEQFQNVVLQATWFRADGQIIAADGDAWIGMSALGYFEHSHSGYNMFTGVDRAYRGRHIALALKLLVIRCALKYGATHIRTNNNSNNAPMFAINRKLGYQFEPGVYEMVLRISGEPSTDEH